MEIFRKLVSHWNDKNCIHPTSRNLHAFPSLPYCLVSPPDIDAFVSFLTGCWWINGPLPYVNLFDAFRTRWCICWFPLLILKYLRIFPHIGVPMDSPTDIGLWICLPRVCIFVGFSTRWYIFGFPHLILVYLWVPTGHCGWCGFPHGLPTRCWCIYGPPPEVDVCFWVSLADVDVFVGFPTSGWCICGFRHLKLMYLWVSSPDVMILMYLWNSPRVKIEVMN